ncbi:tyrosine-type recombinase/integrase [Halosaccharopolyspora lacisalsi]|uniref:tyrosine-type recombinase/integrase n=1 Tax=Halosaccharopolyspora lacisalsi TaxID=1000566 RepID=UPI002E2836B6|nr:tyrosine-type recombinase/integrase [Halosaccharopolyspora lacisalsi]
MTAFRSSDSDSAGVPPVRAALDSFAHQLRNTRQQSGHYTSEHTVRSYRSTWRVLVPEETTPVSELDGVELATRFRRQWGRSSPTTWNAKRAAVRAFTVFACQRGWLDEDLAAGLCRQPQPDSTDRARGRYDLDRLLRDKRHPLRERTLWRLLYATFARADEILALNVEDLDLRNRHAWITRKGGDRDRVAWDSTTARLLSRLIGQRSHGPVFLTHRSAKGAGRGEVDAADLDPETGRGRLSYNAALKLFKEATGGWTFHDLRHSRLTHAAEDGVPTTVLRAKSGHRDLRSLSRYAKPSVEDAQRQVDQAREHRNGKTR